MPKCSTKLCLDDNIVSHNRNGQQTKFFFLTFLEGDNSETMVKESVLSELKPPQKETDETAALMFWLSWETLRKISIEFIRKNTKIRATRLCHRSLRTKTTGWSSDSSGRNASGHLKKKKRSFSFLTGCNSCLQTRQYTDAPKYNPHYTPCHCGLADTCGIKKTEAATDVKHVMNGRDGLGGSHEAVFSLTCIFQPLAKENLRGFFCLFFAAIHLIFFIQSSFAAINVLIWD